MKAKEELDKLISEIGALREKSMKEDLVAKAGQVSKDLGIEARLGELRQLVSKMLNETEETVSDHPIPTVAGALALGILIGWMTTHQAKST